MSVIEIAPGGYGYITTFQERTYNTYQRYYGNGVIYGIVPQKDSQKLLTSD